MNRVEIVLGGAAGQGFHFAATVLCDAAVKEGYRHVTQVGFYGTMARMGASRSEVIIAREEIDFPAAVQPDIVLALSASELKSQAARARPGALVLADEGLSDAAKNPHARFYQVPMSSMAVKELGSGMLTSLIGVGIIAGMTGIISLPSLEYAVEKQPAHIRENNLRAIRRGYELGCSLHSPELDSLVQPLREEAQ